jgi:hypothetical protein
MMSAIVLYSFGQYGHILIVCVAVHGIVLSAYHCKGCADLLVLNVVHTGVSFPGHSCCMGSIAGHVWLFYRLLHLYETSVRSLSCK